MQQRGEDGDAASWTRRRRVPWYVRYSADAAVILLTIAVLSGGTALSLLFGWVSGQTSASVLAYCRPIGAVAAASPVALGLLLVAFARWEAALPGERLRAARQKAQTTGKSAPGEWTGTISACADPDRPALRWRRDIEGDEHVVIVTTQPFVVTRGHEAWLIDTKHVEVARGARSGGSSPWYDVKVGDKVDLFPVDGEMVSAPPWADVAENAEGYRAGRRINRVIATQDEPVRLLVHDRAPARFKWQTDWMAVPDLAVQGPESDLGATVRLRRTSMAQSRRARGPSE